MWTQDDASVQAFAAMLTTAHPALNDFLEAVWRSFEDKGGVPKTPGYAILFTIGKFSQAFEDRKKLHAGEHVMDSLHAVMNHILADPMTQTLMGQLTGQAINGAVNQSA